MDIKEDEFSHRPLDAIDESYDLLNIPLEHCLYCRNHNVMTVALCQCGLWFCNSSGNAQSGSHIFVHLMKSSHKIIENHPQNVNHSGKYECAKCKKNDAFVLEILPDGSILCRKCCQKFRENNRDAKVKQLIESNRVNPCKIHLPSAEEDKKAVKVKQNHIKVIEKNIATGENPFDGLENVPEIAPPLPKIKKTYSSLQEYYEIYVNMLRQDMNYQRRTLSEAKISNLQIKVTKNQGKFEYDSLNQKIRLRIGTLISIEINKKNFDALVVKVDKTGDKIDVLIYKLQDFANGIYNFTLLFKFIEVGYQRMLEGLGAFRNGRVFKKIANVILGKNINSELLNVGVSQSLNAENLPNLNSFQEKCVEKALKSRFSLIQGPPGTGKTHVSATIVYNFAKNLDKLKDKILVCSSSNAAVDNFAARIYKTGVKVVKVFAKSREKFESDVDYLGLHTLTRAFVKEKHPGFMNTYMMKVDFDEWLNEEQMRSFLEYQKEAHEAILSSAKVICSTCVTSFDSRLDGFNYKYVVIDEANQTTEPESLLPLLRGCKQAVLVGDHMQLGPFTACQATSQAGLSRSLYSRLVHLGISPIVLNYQYRMHPSISAFPKEFFYNGLLVDGITVNDRRDISQNIWPNNHPVVFLHHKDGEGRGIGKSFVNPSEAFIVKECIEKLVSLGVQLDRIEILTPYLGQKQYFLTMNMDYRVHTIDEFQGSERDFVVFSTVRSNDTKNIGFLNDFRRLNVAITRAKFAMIVVGDAELLAMSKLWGHLIKFYSDSNMLFEGKLGGLRRIQIDTPALLPFDFRQDFSYADSQTK